MGPGCQLMQLRRTVAMVAGDVMMANSTWRSIRGSASADAELFYRASGATYEYIRVFESDNMTFKTEKPTDKQTDRQQTGIKNSITMNCTRGGGDTHARCHKF